MRVAVFVFIGVHSWLIASAQSFETAAIKPNSSGTNNSHGHSDNGGINFENYSLRRLIQSAYDVKDYALSAPAWLADEHFDIVARTPEGGPGNQFPLMMQSLLAERFGLKVHKEPKSISGYALVAGKKPPVLHEKPAGAGSNTNSNGGKLVGTNVSMDRLADILSRFIREPVQDQTGLTGVMDVTLEWTPDQSDPTANGPGSIFTALQEQLGLKLQPEKITIDTLVVDHIDRVPTEN
jgi:bla regulator protein BlaR1